jgi:hypothetical protein
MLKVKRQGKNGARTAGDPRGKDSIFFVVRGSKVALFTLLVILDVDLVGDARVAAAEVLVFPVAHDLS